MYDYKFSQDASSRRGPRSTWHKRLPLVAGLALAAGLLFGIIYLGLTRHSDVEIPETDSDAIPLPLPPYTKPEDDIRASDPDPSSRQRP